MLEFSALLNAVKPKERTDKYVILAALYFLRNSDANSTTVAEINKLLRLHLRKNAPKNISASLVKYGNYVERISADLPVRWKLTSNGLEHFRSLSGLQLAVTPQDSEYGIDIGVICALEHPEFSALIRALGGIDNWKDIGQSKFSHVYRQSEFKTNGGSVLRIVGTVATSMGLTAAAIATTQLIMQFKPRMIIMVGIAAGTKSSNKEFGDVLIADPSVDYNSGKVVSENGIRDFLPDPYPIGINARLRSILQRYKVPNSIVDGIKKRWNFEKPRGNFKIHLGPVGAADQVIDDESRVLEIQKNWRKLIGVEMETYGVYRSCHEAPDPKPRFASFKSVCDFAANKSDSWQSYAAYTAAEFAIEFLKNEWESIWPSTRELS